MQAFHEQGIERERSFDDLPSNRQEQLPETLEEEWYLDQETDHDFFENWLFQPEVDESWPPPSFVPRLVRFLGRYHSAQNRKRYQKTPGSIHY